MTRGMIIVGLGLAAGAILAPATADAHRACRGWYGPGWCAPYVYARPAYPPPVVYYPRPAVVYAPPPVVYAPPPVVYAPPPMLSLGVNIPPR